MKPGEEKLPFIVNLDSAFDWTGEVRQIWERLDVDGIRQRITPQIPSGFWLRRGSELAVVGLVSSLVIDDSYHLPQGKESQQGAPKDEDPLSRDWRERQLGRRERETGNDRSCHRSDFTGEEPFFRSPRLGRAGVVECYGIYVEAAAPILCSRGLLDKVPVPLHQAPAMFLCPERINEIYPILIRLGENLRHPLPLSLNPALVNLTTTLLHELGHHFFPVHRSGSGRFLAEALANLFCYHGLDQQLQAWLLYKTWHLQPPEYSAYRPLNVLRESDADCHAAVAVCFDGDLSGWTSLPKKDAHAFERALGAGLTMALAADAAACKGLWWDELRQLVSDENRWLLRWDDGHLHFHINRHSDGDIPADFVLDLYQHNDLADWASVADLPSRLWGRWAYGNGVQWPHDCITVAEAEAGKWLAYYAASQDTPLASVICEKLLSLIQTTPGVAIQPALGAALNRALAVATDRQALWFDRVPAIRLIQTCAELGAIPDSEARWMFAHFTVELESVAAESDWGDVHDAATVAVASLRAGALKAFGGKDREPTG